LAIVAFETPMINTAACLYRKEALEEVNGFDESLVRHEDIDLSRRIAWKGWSFNTAPEARAQVFWDGGWPEYLSRAIDNGRTKPDYNLKWFPAFSWARERRIFLNQIHRLIEQIKLYLQSRDIFWAQKNMIDATQLLGKLTVFPSYVVRSHQKDLHPETWSPSKLISKDPKWSLPSSQIVIGQKEQIYLLDVRTSKVAILNAPLSNAFLCLVGWQSGTPSEAECKEMASYGFVVERG
jgi:hypothetical protein